MKAPRTKKVKRCLLCKNNNLKKVFSLGNLFVSNFVKKDQINNGVKAPLTLMYCSQCTLLQLSHIAPQEIMYRKFYWYRSGVTKIMQLALKNIFNETQIKTAPENINVKKFFFNKEISINIKKFNYNFKRKFSAYI